MVIKKEVTTVEAFAPRHLSVFNEMQQIDNLYRGVCKEEDQRRMHINGLMEVLKKLKKKNSLSVMIANGLFEDVSPEGRRQLIKNTNDSINNLMDGYKGIIEQRKHRSDELGYVRVRAFKAIAETLIYWHGFNHSDLMDLLTEKPVVKDKRDIGEIDEDIRLAMESDLDG